MTAGHTLSPVIRMSCTPLHTISSCIHPPPLSPCLSWIAVVSLLREPPRSRLPGIAGLGHEPVHRYPGYRATRRFFTYLLRCQVDPAGRSRRIAAMLTASSFLAPLFMRHAIPPRQVKGVDLYCSRLVSRTFPLWERFSF